MHSDTPGSSANNGVQGLLNDENHARPSRGHHRHIACELNCVPKPFIGVDENGLALCQQRPNCSN